MKTILNKIALFAITASFVTGCCTGKKGACCDKKPADAKAAPAAAVAPAAPAADAAK